MVAYVLGSLLALTTLAVPLARSGSFIFHTYITVLEKMILTVRALKKCYEIDGIKSSWEHSRNREEVASQKPTVLTFLVTVPVLQGREIDLRARDYCCFDLLHGA